MEKAVPISISSFYNKQKFKNELNLKLLNSSCNSHVVMPYKVTDLVNGPSLTWKVFNKQADVLNYISLHTDYLMAFVFETSTTRMFLAAHPEVFWHYDSQRPANSRCSYEIIPENTACKLYFDIEFNKELNPTKNGCKIVNVFIYIVLYYFRTKFKIDCSIENVLNLDSSTASKFSCHLIFNIPNVCFANNHEAGNFVHFICSEIVAISDTEVLPKGLDNVSFNDVCDLFVKDSKGNTSLICDKSVYSRNRHFRLYKSTKYGKLRPLVLSSENKFKPPGIDKDGDREIFYFSLITYLNESYEKLRVLHFEYAPREKRKRDSLPASLETINSDITATPFIKVDNFIKDVVFPGKIFRSCYFSSSNIINYDILGNRYCGNIGRSHKSNNVKYVVDLKEGVYYQKCHDYECAGYKSEKKPLPKGLKLSGDSEDSSNLGTFNMSPKKPLFQRFPSCGLSDQEIIENLPLNCMES